ncbi:MAG: hypothetical protein H0U81_13155 [Pyrinomonadaceae bacterium]|nr:hypothetical protein [Pyrinomonadaceae bacterium]
MSPYWKSVLLFALNWLDAQLTIVWVRGGWATEGNALMASLLEIGDTPFLFTKLTIGALVAYILYRWSHLRVARHGMKLVLGLYLLLMLVHTATGMSALGWSAPEKFVAYASYLPESLFALIL